MKKYFGTDGIRGIANEELTADIAYKIGQYLGHLYEGKNILIGSDTRVSKDMLEAALCAGITSYKANAHLLKVCTTPSVSFLTNKYDYEIGIMISASHNPYYDNGIKLFNNMGEKISNEIEVEIEKYIDGLVTLEKTSQDNIGIIVDVSHLLDDYLMNLKGIVTQDLIDFNIVVDSANGSASFLGKKLFDMFNIKATYLNNTPDGYNINEKCGSTHLDILKEAVVKQKAMLGIAFDGDADRMLAVDSEGNEINGDKIMYICAKLLKTKNILNGNHVVTTIMSNIGLYKALDNIGIKYLKTSVGDKYVYEQMKLHDYSIGGEQSGHIIFNEYSNTGDGLLSALMFMAAIKESKQDLNEILNEVFEYPQVLINVKVRDKDIVLNSEELKSEVNKIEKELENEGRVLLRASGTEPLIRVMVEAKSDELASKHAQHLIEVVKKIS